MLYGIIYGLYHPVSGELRYIGQTQGALSRRLSGHLCDARRGRGVRYVLQWMRSLLGEGTKPVIKELARAFSQEELNRLEISSIAKARAEGVRLTNHADGGLGAPGRKMSAAHHAKLHHPDVVARMAATRRGQPSPRKGVTLTRATRAKISVAKLGNQCRFRHDVDTTEMARLRAEGHPYCEIGRRLGVSKTTVVKRLQRAAT